MEYQEHNFATKGVANTGLGLGIAGTALGLLSGGLGNIGIGNAGQAVSKESFDLSMQLQSEKTRAALLEADLSSEKKMVELYTSLNDKINRVVTDQTAINSAQAVNNCAMTSQLAVLNNNVATLMGMTKTVIPNSSVCPGWGTATVTVGTGTTTA